MNKQQIESQAYVNWRVFLLLFLLILISYSNTFHSSFHLDDFHNITQNSKLHLKDLYPDTITNAIFGNSVTGRVFYRPVSNITLALNWYFDKTDVTKYHMVNIGIHIMTAFFLYLAILSLFDTPNLAGRYSDEKYFIAFMAAALWAVNPIQTQAVTYIVQRMAAMAAMFSILGIFFYIKARTSHFLNRKIIWFAGSLISFLLAVGSKENALMLPVSILLLEMAFFHNMSNPNTRKNIIWFGASLIPAIVVIGMFLFLNGDFIGRILDGYEKRTFTLSERILTQPRIVVFYLTQIFYPIADRLSLDHDIIVSSSLFSPWTTLPAIIFIVSIVMGAFWQINKRPLICFAVLFFFANHAIESSILPLELIFEHRNYLPSLFLFLPVAAGFKWLINYYSIKKAMAGLLIGFITVLIMMLGLGTYIRNMAWVDEKTLWEDTIEKAPGRARAYQNLASSYYMPIEDYEMVMELCEKAMHLDDNTLYKAEEISLANIANVYAKQKKSEKAIQTYKRILHINPEKYSAIYHLALAMIETEQLEEAVKYVNQLLSDHPDSARYLNTYALILLKKNEPDKAIQYLKKAIHEGPDNEKTLLSLGAAKMMLGQYRPAERYLKRISDRSDNAMTAGFLLMENSLKAGDFQQAKTHARSLISRFSPAKIQHALVQINTGGLQWPVTTGMITPVIAEILKDQSNRILELGDIYGG